MDQRAIIEKARKDLAFLQGDVLGVLLYGSWATGEGHEIERHRYLYRRPSSEKTRPPTGDAPSQLFVMTALTSGSSS